MAIIHRLEISPPLMNSSSAWASENHQLKDLYDSRFTGAVTTRTATLKGFPEDPSVHTVAFSRESTSSLNSYGYSPHPLAQYIQWVEQLCMSDPHSTKPIIISITSSSSHDLNVMISVIQDLRMRLKDQAGSLSRIAIELNTSCPNIKDTTPQAYEPKSLLPLLEVMALQYQLDPTLTLGLKLPPYVYAKQFTEIVDVVASLSRPNDTGTCNPVAFLTCTNTLGSSLLYGDQTVSRDTHELEFAVPTVLGGLAGEAIHALSLGNVHSFSKLLAEHNDAALQRISIIGVGGVTSPAAVERMRRVGAKVVACATLLGLDGVTAFESLSKQIPGY